MSYEFEIKVFRLTSKQREILGNGEQLFKNARVDLGLEKYFDIDYLSSPAVRQQALEILDKYQKQLTLEWNFYTEFHQSFIKEINGLACELSSNERDKFLLRSLPGLEENNLIRMNINSEKSEAIAKLIRVINLFDSNEVAETRTDESIVIKNPEDVSKVETLFSEIDSHLDEQENLAMIQQKRGVDGQKYFERLINIFKNA